MHTKTLLLALLGAMSVSAATIKRQNGGADFGKCTPTMDLKAGRPGRGANEKTFLPTDPLITGGQQDALNPNIIAIKICDQLTNVCGANQAAKDLCGKAKAKLAAAGVKDASAVTIFNGALGF
ncbi:hypothetical protein LZ30DRAFT_738061 [Colletotrichum cereale]|nr:hypothetical protein LZ30DRAFT_738061 [Colletotrichum cereale]